MSMAPEGKAGLYRDREDINDFDSIEPDSLTHTNRVNNKRTSKSETQTHWAQQEHLVLCRFMKIDEKFWPRLMECIDGSRRHRCWQHSHAHLHLSLPPAVALMNRQTSQPDKHLQTVSVQIAPKGVNASSARKLQLTQIFVFVLFV